MGPGAQPGFPGLAGPQPGFQGQAFGQPGGLGGFGPRPGEQLFQYVDGYAGIGKDGTISWEEFGNLAAQIGWSRAEAQQLWYSTDTDRSGKLDRAEFLTFCARPDVTPWIQKLEREVVGQAVGQAGLPQRLFDRIAGAQGVRLSWNDFLPVVMQCGWEVAQAQVFWQQTDTDRSGSLDRNEFVQFCNRPDVQPHIERMCRQINI